MPAYLSSEASPCGCKVDLCYDGCCIRWNLRGRVPGCHIQPELLIVIYHLLPNLYYKPAEKYNTP